MRINKIAYWIFFLFFFLLNNDLTSQTLTLQTYLQLVRQNHPAARQAFLLTEQAEATLLQARGGFDPKLYGDWERKSFDGKNYFNIGEGGVKVPTWFGVEGKLAYNYTSGVFLNPENKLPSDGQAIVGLTASLLQGLVIDERRARLFQANILRSANENERRLQINNLLLDASKTYWNWALASEWLGIYEQAVAVAIQRFEGLRESYLQGDKPAIDTLEAFIQVQDRTMQLNEARVVLRNANLALQNFLWGNENPLPIDTTQQPTGLVSPAEMPLWLSAPVDELASAHPDILKYDFQNTATGSGAPPQSRTAQAPASTLATTSSATASTCARQPMMAVQVTSSGTIINWAQRSVFRSCSARKGAACS